MNSELILFAQHLHNTLSVILKKYNEGKQLTEDEEQMLWELYLAKDEMLQTINNKFNN